MRGMAGLIQKVLKKKEKAIAEMITQAREATKKAQIQRIEGQETRGEKYKVGDLVRIKLDSYEIKKKGKKMAAKYSGKYRVIKVLGEGWTYGLEPVGWKGRRKERHFNDLKDAGRLVQHGSDESDDDGTEGDRRVRRNRDTKDQTAEAIDRQVVPSKLDKPLVSSKKPDLIKSKMSPKSNAKISPPILINERPKRTRKPPSRLQVGIENSNKRYTELCTSAAGSDNDEDDSSGCEEERGSNADISQISSTDDEWHSGTSSGSTHA